MIGKAVFALQNSHFRVRGEARCGGYAGNAATDDDDIVHTSSILSVAGGSVGDKLDI